MHNRRVVPTVRRRPTVRQRRPRRGEHDEGLPGVALEQRTEHVEHGAVGPVQVGEDDRQRPTARQGGSERQHGPGRLVAGPRHVDAAEHLEPEQVQQPVGHPLDLSLPARRLRRRGVVVPGSVNHRGHGAAHLGCHVLLAVARLDVAGGTHRLGQWPPHVGLAVRHATAVEDKGVVAAAGDLGDLVHQPRLADARVADEEQQRRPTAGDGQVERVGEERDLVVAADQRGAGAVGSVAGRQSGTFGHPGRHRGLPALGRDLAHRSVGDHPTGGEVGGLPHQHLPRLGGRLQPLGRVHDVAHRGVVAACPQRAYEDLARVHPHAQAHADTKLCVHGGECLVQLEGGPHGPLGVVLVGDGGAEQGQDGIAHDLVDPSAEGDDVGDQPLEAPVHQLLDLLGVAVLRQCGEPDQVGEHDGDHAPFVAAHLQVGTARRAEPRAVRHLGAARGAGHAGECRDAAQPATVRTS